MKHPTPTLAQYIVASGWRVTGFRGLLVQTNTQPAGPEPGWARRPTIWRMRGPRAGYVRMLDLDRVLLRGGVVGRNQLYPLKP